MPRDYARHTDVRAEKTRRREHSARGVFVFGGLGAVQKLPAVGKGHSHEKQEEDDNRCVE